jgi:hypothetical protein
MFCPICWKEYPKGMRHCDSCRAELIEEKPMGLKEKEGQETAKKPGGDKKTEKEK